MHCLLCATPMTEVLHTRAAEDFSLGHPACLYQCPQCETLCQHQLSIHGGQVWLFANGSSFSLTEDALDDPPFCTRFRLMLGIGGSRD